MKKIKQEINRPAANLPYQNICRPFRLQYLVPMAGIEILQDANGVCFISAKGGSLSNLVAGDNINIETNAEGNTVISAVGTAREIAGGENVIVSIDPETGIAVVSAYFDGVVDSHYKGIFDSTESLTESVPAPVQGDYCLIRDLVFSNGEYSWNGRYKVCFYDLGQWVVVDQMLTFTDNPELVKDAYSIGGASPVIYLPEVCRTGSFRSLRDIPIVATPVLTVEGLTVTAACETEGAEIWYSTDGTMPHVNARRYTGPVTVAEATTLRFVGIKNGMINSHEATVSLDYSLQAPVISLDWTNGEISITNPNANGEIFYTSDGRNPTNRSTRYTGPFTHSLGILEWTYGLKAVIYDAGTGLYSPVSSETYEKTYLISLVSSEPATGILSVTYRVVKSFQDHSPIAEGEVHYTSDGSTPDIESTEMTDIVYLSRYGGITQYKVIGFRQGFLPSYIYNHSLGYEKPSAPAISYNAEQGMVNLSLAGNLTEYPSVPLKTDNAEPNIGARIYYTLDGSTPTSASPVYSEPFNIAYVPSTTTTVKAISVVESQESPISSETFQHLKWRGTVVSEENLLVGIEQRGPRQSENGASVYYAITVSGQQKPAAWTPYTGLVEYDYFSEDNPKTVWFKQTKPGYVPSIYSGVPFGFNTPDAPTISYDVNSKSATLALAGNTILIPLQTNNNTPTLGARIYYTLDGSTPTSSNGTLYDGNSVEMRNRETLKAVTICYGKFESEVSSHTAPQPTAEFSPVFIARGRRGLFSAFEGPSYYSEEDSSVYFAVAIPEGYESFRILDQLNHDITNMLSLERHTIDNSLKATLSAIPWGDNGTEEKDALLSFLDRHSGDNLFITTGDWGNDRSGFELQPISLLHCAVIMQNGQKIYAEQDVESVPDESYMIPLEINWPDGIDPLYVTSAIEGGNAILHAYGNANTSWNPVFSRNGVIYHPMQAVDSIAGGINKKLFFTANLSDRPLYIHNEGFPRFSYGYNNRWSFMDHNNDGQFPFVQLIGDLRNLSVENFDDYDGKDFMFVRLFENCRNLQEVDITVPCVGNKVLSRSFRGSGTTMARIREISFTGNTCYERTFENENLQNFDLYTQLPVVDARTINDSFVDTAIAGTIHVHPDAFVDNAAIPPGWTILYDNVE